MADILAEARSGHPRSGHPQSWHPRSGYPWSGFPWSGYPWSWHSRSGYPWSEYPSLGTPWCGYFWSGYPRFGYPQSGYLHPGHPMSVSQPPPVWDHTDSGPTQYSPRFGSQCLLYRARNSQDRTFLPPKLFPLLPSTWTADANAIRVQKALQFYKSISCFV